MAVRNREQVNEILHILKEIYPEAKTELEFGNPLEILIATILSAQCTDERVNKVTPVLFEKYRTVEHYAEADIEELKEIIRSTGFFNQKAKFIKEAAKKIVVDFNSTVPHTMEKLTALPGVARKTANVVMGAGFGKVEGIAVDTHVKRVSYRLGITDEKDPDKIEKDLMGIFPPEEWIFISNALIWHGRRICKAQNPKCNNCPLKKSCPSFN